MLYVRVRGPNGVEQGTFEDGRIVTAGGASITPLEPESLQLPEPYELLTPLAAPRSGAPGHLRAVPGGVEESAVKDVYTMVYDAPRPELFMKDAGMRRTVAPGRPIGIRGDSSWNVPEPEIGVVLGTNGRIAGYTIGNDVSSRDIEGANPLYLPQAKIYAGACSFGPTVFVPDGAEPHFHLTLRVTDEWGRIVFEGESFTSTMRRSFTELLEWLLIDNPVPPGSVLLTGTGLVPPDSFTLLPGHFVEIHVPRSARSSTPSSVPPS